MEPGVNRQIAYFLRDYKHGKTLAKRYLRLINSATYRQEKSKSRTKRPDPKFQELFRPEGFADDSFRAD